MTANYITRGRGKLSKISGKSRKIFKYCMHGARDGWWTSTWENVITCFIQGKGKTMKFFYKKGWTPWHHVTEGDTNPTPSFHSKVETAVAREAMEKPLRLRPLSRAARLWTFDLPITVGGAISFQLTVSVTMKMFSSVLEEKISLGFRKRWTWE